MSAVLVTLVCKIFKKKKKSCSQLLYVLLVLQNQGEIFAVCGFDKMTSAQAFTKACEPTANGIIIRGQKCLGMRKI